MCGSVETTQRDKRIRRQSRAKIRGEGSAMSTYMTHREVGGQLGMTTQHVAREVRRNPDGIARYDEWMKKWRDKYPSKLSVV